MQTNTTVTMVTASSDFPFLVNVKGSSMDNGSQAEGHLPISGKSIKNEFCLV